MVAAFTHLIATHPSSLTYKQEIDKKKERIGKKRIKKRVSREGIRETKKYAINNDRNIIHCCHYLG